MAGFTIAVVFAFVTLSNVATENRRLAREGQEAHQAICSFKADLIRRVGSTQQLLDDHEGEPVIFAIPRSVLESSVVNQQKTVDALKNLDCT
jgi:hypothetical protein